MVNINQLQHREGEAGIRGFVVECERERAREGRKVSQEVSEKSRNMETGVAFLSVNKRKRVKKGVVANTSDVHMFKSVMR